MHWLQQIAQSEQITITTYLELEKQTILYLQAGSLQFIFELQSDSEEYEKHEGDK